MQSTTPELTLYYDGQCPLCQAEMAFLQTRNAAGRLAFVDITQTGFEASAQPFSCDAAMAQIHGRLANGEVLVGVPVFSKAYALANLPFLSWLLSRRWLMPILQPSLCFVRQTPPCHFQTHRSWRFVVRQALLPLIFCTFQLFLRTFLGSSGPFWANHGHKFAKIAFCLRKNKNDVTPRKNRNLQRWLALQIQKRRLAF